MSGEADSARRSAERYSRWFVAWSIGMIAMSGLLFAAEGASKVVAAGIGAIGVVMLVTSAFAIGRFGPRTN